MGENAPQLTRKTLFSFRILTAGLLTTRPPSTAMGLRLWVLQFVLLRILFSFALRCAKHAQCHRFGFSAGTDRRTNRSNNECQSQEQAHACTPCAGHAARDGTRYGLLCFSARPAGTVTVPIVVRIAAPRLACQRLSVLAAVSKQIAMRLQGFVMA
ncbi:hypothetical protein CPLU01_00416 [Colletotrichum plurivorum]|uniref:Uncharacterized protein n=1 Tax=Colletotrichum plurivorum TaxID=2175906 RepID=A0A8H6NSI6_9PEZI|nr:hypothetical protein CPLU01_00416 [Colletotrichum plurivorum]